MFISQAFAQAAPAAPAAPESFFGSLGSMPPLLLMFVVLYFVMIRPQMKRQKEHKAMIDALQKGDEVVVGGGLIGRVAKLGESIVHVEVASNVEIQVQRGVRRRCCPRAPQVIAPPRPALPLRRGVRAAGKEAAMNRYPLWKNTRSAGRADRRDDLHAAELLRRGAGRAGSAAPRRRSRSTARWCRGAAGHRAAGIEADFVQLDGTSVKARASRAPTRSSRPRTRSTRRSTPRRRPELHRRALNLLSRSPHWLTALHALPMYLGLDLRGGVHFLMQVDMKAALTKRPRR